MTLVDKSERVEHESTEASDEWMVYNVTDTETGDSTTVRVNYGFSSYGGCDYYGVDVVVPNQKTIIVWEKV